MDPPPPSKSRVRTRSRDPTEWARTRSDSLGGRILSFFGRRSTMEENARREDGAASIERQTLRHKTPDGLYEQYREMFSRTPTITDYLDVASGLKEAGINLLALDFDLTVVDIHTSGRWLREAEELEHHVRPVFRALIEASKIVDLQVAIVTFSPQTDMIGHVLKIAFPGFHDEIPIRGADGTWTYNGRGSRKGKQAHIASVAEELSEKKGLEVTRQSTLLIDDDFHNVETALQNGVKALWCDPQEIIGIEVELRELAGILETGLGTMRSIYARKGEEGLPDGEEGEVVVVEKDEKGHVEDKEEHMDENEGKTRGA